MRLDVYLVQNKLVKTRSEGLDLIKRGFVSVDGQVITKGGFDVLEHQNIVLKERRAYVSRAGDKLKDAIDSFQLALNEMIIVDIGSSTGGFTDCALQHGASQVYAYDVGSNQLDDQLRMIRGLF